MLKIGCFSNYLLFWRKKLSPHKLCKLGSHLHSSWKKSPKKKARHGSFKTWTNKEKIKTSSTIKEKTYKKVWQPSRCSQSSQEQKPNIRKREWHLKRCQLKSSFSVVSANQSHSLHKSKIKKSVHNRSQMLCIDFAFLFVKSLQLCPSNILFVPTAWESNSEVVFIC